MPIVPAPGAAGLRNELLRALPAGELDQLQPHLVPVSLYPSQVLHEAGAPVQDAYFIEAGLVILVADTGDNGRVEVGMTGRDGFAGVSLILRPDPASIHCAAVQASGHAHRIGAAALRELAGTLPTLRDRCLRYVESMLAQVAQVAACNARHGLPERLARWLSMSRDRIGADELPITQEALSAMLGVRRAGVSIATNALQARGVIRQARGRVVVLDRPGLAARACSCYAAIERSRAGIMGPPPR